MIKQLFNISFVVKETVTEPSHYYTSKFVKYLIQDVVTDNMSILDICAGAGTLGFAILRSCNVKEMSFSEINPNGIESIKATASLKSNRFPRSKIKWWLSDGFKSIPKSEKYDLIIGNPPHQDRPAYNLEDLQGADQDWKFHINFFKECHKYLNPNGKICFIENNGWTYTSPRFFKKMINKYSKLRYDKDYHRFNSPSLFTVIAYQDVPKKEEDLP